MGGLFEFGEYVWDVYLVLESFREGCLIERVIQCVLVIR